MSILPELQQVNWELFFACDSLNANPFQPTGLSILHGFPHFFHGLGISKIYGAGSRLAFK